MIAQQLVVMVRTKWPIVTDMRHVHTDFGTTTSVIARTSILGTCLLVLVAGAIVDTIAADKDRQAVVLAWTPKVCLGA